MTILGIVERVYRRLDRLVFGDGGDEETAVDGTGDGTGAEDREVLSDAGYDPDELQCRVDTLVELGLTPEEFVRRLLDERGGQLEQQAFTDHTDWSETTVSRVLTGMEEDGAIERIQLGREKVVYLPHHAPTSDFPPALGNERDDIDSARSS